MTIELLKWIAASFCFLIAAVSALAYWLLPAPDVEGKASGDRPAAPECVQADRPCAAQPQLHVVEGGYQPPRHCA